MANDHQSFPHAAQLLEDDGGIRADLTTTRAGKCRMSVGAARLSSKDLEAIQKRALAEGLPYQTLMSSLLHKYASGRLKEV
jgi:predicted DNA binding CopG/RHH family protein